MIEQEFIDSISNARNLIDQNVFRPDEYQTIEIVRNIIDSAYSEYRAGFSHNLEVRVLLICAIRFSSLPRKNLLEIRQLDSKDLIREKLVHFERLHSVLTSYLSGTPKTEDATVEYLVNTLYSLCWSQYIGGEEEFQSVRFQESSTELPFDPLFSSSHFEMANVFVPSTPCIFAQRGRYWGAPDWDTQMSFEANIEKFAKALARFLRIGRPEQLDGILLKAPAKFSESVPALASTTARVLAGLNKVDPALSDCLATDICAPNWKYQFAGEHMFLTTFGSCYPSDHPRQTFGQPATYYFFQPDFTLRNHPSLSPSNELRTRDAVLSAFERKGVTYANHNKRNEAERYIRPMAPDERAVKWWDYLD